MTRTFLYTGTLQKAHHADDAPTAHGIYRWDRSGTDQPWGGPVLTPTLQPGWICLATDGQTLYALNEVKELEGETGGAVSAFRVAPDTGDLTALNRLRLPGNPCHGLVEATGRYLLIATFHGGTVHMIRLAPDGSLDAEVARHQHQGSSVHPKRQTSPHPHGIAISPDNKFVMVPDLGTDRVEVYALDTESGTLDLRKERGLSLPAGSGPRHAVFSQDGKHLYVINEMNATIAVLEVADNTGALSWLQSCDLLPEGFAGLRSGGEIALNAKGLTLYASTRSHGSSGLPASPGIDTMAWFDVDPATGLLRFAGRVPSGGGIARAFVIEPDQRHLLVAHQCTGTLVRFAIDAANGALSNMEEPLKTPVPVGLIFGLAN